MFSEQVNTIRLSSKFGGFVFFSDRSLLNPDHSLSVSNEKPTEKGTVGTEVKRN